MNGAEPGTAQASSQRSPFQQRMWRRMRRVRASIERWPPWARKAAGVALILGGTVGFLPIVGFWMIPLGLLILSLDIPAVRRFRRKLFNGVNGRR